MKTLQVETQTKRIIHFLSIKGSNKKIIKIGAVLKNLGLDKTGTGKSKLSINHDNILYK